MFNSHRQDCSAVAGTIVQQSLARLFTSHWNNCSTVTGTIVQQSLAQSFKSQRHNHPTVTITIVQQSLAQLFNSHGQDSFFFHAGRILFIQAEFTAEESCQVPGIRHMILYRLYINLYI